MKHGRGELWVQDEEQINAKSKAPEIWKVELKMRETTRPDGEKHNEKVG